MLQSPKSLFFFFNDTATTEIYTLSLHDALPISRIASARMAHVRPTRSPTREPASTPAFVERRARSEEHTYELQSRLHLVCRLLLEKKKKKICTSKLKALSSSRTSMCTCSSRRSV